MSTPELRKLVGRVAVLTRHRADDDPELEQARRDLAAEAEGAHVRRALDDPAQLARAARIVRAALARKRLTLAELVPADAPTTRAAS